MTKERLREASCTCGKVFMISYEDPRIAGRSEEWLIDKADEQLRKARSRHQDKERCIDASLAPLTSGPVKVRRS